MTQFYISILILTFQPMQYYNLISYRFLTNRYINRFPAINHTIVYRTVRLYNERVAIKLLVACLMILKSLSLNFALYIKICFAMNLNRQGQFKYK
jgi:hypothetical protein